MKSGTATVYSLESFAMAVPSVLVTLCTRDPTAFVVSKLNLKPEICGKRPSPGQLLTPFSRAFHRFSPVITDTPTVFPNGYTARASPRVTSYGATLSVPGD